MEQTSSPKSNNSLIIILIIIIVILVLGIGGYFGWKYFLKDRLSTGASATSPSPTKTLIASPTFSPATTSTPTATLTSSKALSGDYVITDSNTRVIETSELIGMTPWQLKVARNEIYARHGRPFVHKDLQCYFATKSWYHGNPSYSDALLTAIENKNVLTIKAYEEKINSPMLNEDTGC